MQGLLQEVMGAGIVAKGQHTPKGRMSGGRNHKQFLATILLQARREICAEVFICNVITNKILEDLRHALQPRRIVVTGTYNARGGITTTVRAEWPEA